MAQDLQPDGPLQVPPGWPPPASGLEIATRYDPLLGGPISAALERHRLLPMRRQIERTLAARPEAPPKVWGDGPARRALALEICQALAERAGWPNAHFLPHDSFAVALDWYWGDLGEVEALMDIEEIIGTRLSQEETDRLVLMTFGEALDFLLGTAKAGDGGRRERQEGPGREH